ncbi:MAG: hypothetical protein ISR82_01825 [Candidatus Marinimicrobia bacterium]|nr:hypothetical protein [Candidatus Neomarinimicrobiota bacterium]MBL7009944.1 hypothetical protein [Candidatus Neomarinimicrobiota bacterium]MBL7029757.1 hypothetical protein [Candidatus Neomarinimicrobiota bacterium]
MNWKTQHILSSFLLFVFFLFACEDKDNAQDLTEAILIFEGDYAVDGCGFFIEMKGKTYKPKDESKIGVAFKNNRITAVLIDYVIPNEVLEYYCNMSPTSQTKEAIEIISIQKK